MVGSDGSIIIWFESTIIFGFSSFGILLCFLRPIFTKSPFQACSVHRGRASPAFEGRLSFPSWKHHSIVYINCQICYLSLHPVFFFKMIQRVYRSFERTILSICQRILTRTHMLNKTFLECIAILRQKTCKALHLDSTGSLQKTASLVTSSESVVFTPSDTWIDFFNIDKKNIDFFRNWSNSQFPRRKLSLGRRKKTLVIDLDETLVHTTNKAIPFKPPDFNVELVLDNQVLHYYVFKRPHVDYFLQKVAAWFNLAIFTASISDYADPVIEWLTLPVRGSVRKKLFRNSCVNMDGVYLKNLALIEPDLSQVFIVDNSVAAFELNPGNGILIDTWIDYPKDEALLDLLPFLDALRFVEDVRSILSLRKIKA